MYTLSEDAEFERYLTDNAAAKLTVRNELPEPQNGADTTEAEPEDHSPEVEELARRVHALVWDHDEVKNWFNGDEEAAKGRIQKLIRKFHLHAPASQ